MGIETGVAPEQLGTAFLTAYGDRDWNAITALLAHDVTWELPGGGPIGGRAEGRDRVLERFRLIVDAGTRTELLHVLVGQRHLALSLRNTGSKPDGRVLDEHLVTLLRLRDGAIAGIETYLSDVRMMESYFADSAVDPRGG